MEEGSRAAAPRARRGRASRPSAAELADVAVAQGALLVALLRARFRPTGRLVAPAQDPAREDAPVALTPAASAPDGCRAVVERATRAIDRAARRGVFRPTCLVRSLALARLLERWGVPGARIRIGVRRGVPTGGRTMMPGSLLGGSFASGGGPRPGPHSAPDSAPGSAPDRTPAPTPGRASGPTPGRAPRPAPADAVRAHAWVELDGRVIGDDPHHVATFTPLGSVTSVSFRWR